MAHRMRVKPTVGDLLVIAAVCLLALLMFLIPVFANRSASYVRVTTEFGETSFLISLDGDFSRTIESAGYALTVTVSNGTVCVSDSTCSDRVCVNSGTISRGGEVIICAPAGVTVEILSAGEEADYVIG